VETLQNLDSQGLIWKIFRNKDLQLSKSLKSIGAALGETVLWTGTQTRCPISVCSVARVEVGVGDVEHGCE